MCDDVIPTGCGGGVRSCACARALDCVIACVRVCVCVYVCACVCVRVATISGMVVAYLQSTMYHVNIF